MWAFGNVIWIYYNFIGVAVPYPSLADTGYFLNGLCWVTGIYVIYRNVNENVLRFFFILMPIVITLCIVIVLLMLYVRGWKLNLSDDPLKFVLDITYPIFDAFISTLMASLIFRRIFKTFDSKMQSAMKLIYIGTVLLLVADSTFSMTTSLPESHPFVYFNGHLADFEFATAFYVLGMGVLLIPLTYEAD